jgi:hypothetical protein
MSNKKNIKKKDDGFQEFIFEMKTVYGEVPDHVVERAREMFRKGEISAYLPRAIRLILQKYNTFDPFSIMKKYIGVAEDVELHMQFHEPSEEIPYPLGAIVPSDPEMLLEYWFVVEPVVSYILKGAAFECGFSLAAVNQIALINERLLYEFIKAASRLDQSLLKTIWQEVREPGSVLDGSTVSAHLLLKLWGVMECEPEASCKELLEDIDSSAELVDILTSRIQEESDQGYLSSDDAFMNFVGEFFPVDCRRSKFDIWTSREREVSGLVRQLGRDITYENEGDSSDVA